jgi:multimeric flavodoxin WrbA/protein-tyrosine-phosphatase
MLVLGLQGSPRKKGNTEFLLSLFMEESRKWGAETRVIDACNMHIEPCREYTTCEKKGFCPIKDDMDAEIYPLLRRAEVVVLASPVFFYNVTAQLKALIDRSQTLWSRKYRLNMTDPNRKMRRGFVLCQGATKGKNLFVGVDLTAKYFFDAVGASFEGGLYYWQIEHRGDMEKHPGVHADVSSAVSGLLKPFLGRKRVMFLSPKDRCRGQMAGGFARYLAGDRVDVLNGGAAPGETLHPLVEKVMAEKGIDMGFCIPRPADEALAAGNPDRIIAIGDAAQCFPGSPVAVWDIAHPGEDMESMRKIRDEIENRVRRLVESL